MAETAAFVLVERRSNRMLVKMLHGSFEIFKQQGAHIPAEAVTHQYAHDHEVFAVSGHGVGRHLPAACEVGWKKRTP